MQRVSAKPTLVKYIFSASIIALIGALFLPLAVGGIDSPSMMSGFQWIGLSIGALIWLPIMTLGVILRFDFKGISLLALVLGINVCWLGTFCSFIIAALAMVIKDFRRLKFLWLSSITLALSVIFLVRNLELDSGSTKETIGIGYFFWLAGLILTICSHLLLSRRA